MSEKNNQDFESNEMEEIVTLTDEEGNNREFYVLAELDYKDKWYIYLEPVELEDDFKEGEVIIFEIGEDENGEETFTAIEDDELLEQVFQVFLDEMQTEEE